VRIVSVRCAHLALQLERLTDDTLGELVLEHAAEKDADRLSSRGLSDHGVVTLVDHKSVSRHGPHALDAIVGRVRETLAHAVATDVDGLARLDAEGREVESGRG